MNGWAQRSGTNSQWPSGPGNLLILSSITAWRPIVPNCRGKSVGLEDPVDWRSNEWLMRAPSWCEQQQAVCEGKGRRPARVYIFNRGLFLVSEME